METIKIKKVGEFQILDRFIQLGIDPEMTRLANIEELSKLPEQIAANGKVEEINGFISQKAVALKSARRAHGIISGEKELLSVAKNDDEKNLIRIEVQNAETIKTEALKKVEEYSKFCDTCGVELGKLNAACDSKRKEHIKANLIYHHPGRGQVGVFPDEFDISALKELQKGLKNQQIVIEFETIKKEVLRIPEKDPIMAPFLKYVSHRVIEDFIGCQYFYKDNNGVWIEEPVIEKLGVTKNTVVHDDFQDQAIEKADMKPEDLEEFRVQNLTTEQKEVEKQLKIDEALDKSIKMRSGLEIKGASASSAKTQATNWYQEQLTEIESKYT